MSVAQAPLVDFESPQFDDPGDGRAVETAQSYALLAEGEMHLAVGDVEEAQAAFDRAASLRHGADIEVSLVRTYMQAGEYRRALAFGAHAAGAHTDFPAATALYA